MKFKFLFFSYDCVNQVNYIVDLIFNQSSSHILPPFPKDLHSFHLSAFPKDLPSFTLFLIWNLFSPFFPLMSLSYGPPLHY